MANRQFQVKYPDGRTVHIDRATRDALLASFAIRETGPRRYRYIAKPLVLHSFAELGKLDVDIEDVRRFLEGSFIVQMGDKKMREALETPAGMTIRLAKQGIIGQDHA